MNPRFVRGAQGSLPFPRWREWLEVSLANYLSHRPEPIRQYDQIHMRIGDLVPHAANVYRFAANKRLLVMGDSDGLVLALELLASRFGAKLAGPSEIHLLDFDLRILNYYRRLGERELAWATPLTLKKYNVFSPVLEGCLGYFDCFHTNPPFGQYNGGRSVMAFVDRCLSMTVGDGRGMLVLGNDPSAPWTREVLLSVHKYLTARGCVVTEAAEATHRYYLDDEPDLRSGLLCFPRLSHSQPEFAAVKKLPDSLRERFYGRETIPIPDYIPAESQQASQAEMELF